MKTSSGTRRLADLHRFPHSKAIEKLLLRLSKSSLLNLVFHWLDDPQCAPHAPKPDHGKKATTYDTIRTLYKEWSSSNAISRRDVMERILEVDWWNGLNAKQIAMLDIQYLYDHPAAIRWTARKTGGANIVDIRVTPLHIGFIVSALHDALDPIFSNHIYATIHPALPLLLVRMQFHEASALHILPPPRRIFYIALPFSSPFIFHSMVKDTSHEMLLQAMAMALSSRKQPVQLFYANLTIRNIYAMVKRCGVSRNASALGAWSIYADNEVDTSPIDPHEKSHNIEEDLLTKSSSIAATQGRFGKKLDEMKDALDKLSFRVEKPYIEADGSVSTFQPSIMLIFEGTNVLAGLREMCEKGMADPLRIPSWLTGEDGMTEGVIRDDVLHRY